MRDAPPAISDEPSKGGVEPLFASVCPGGETVTLFFEGRPVKARAGETVASALLRAGVRAFRRTPESGAPRLPFCMIGHCFECLTEIDGAPNRQACLTLVAEGMKVRFQDGAGRVGA